MSPTILSTAMEMNESPSISHGCPIRFHMIPSDLKEHPVGMTRACQTGRSPDRHHSVSAGNRRELGPGLAARDWRFGHWALAWHLWL